MSRIFEQYSDREKIMVLQLSNSGARRAAMEQREQIEYARDELALLEEAIEMEGPKAYKQIMKRFAKYKRQNSKGDN
jgi:hypothetical protein